MASVLEISEKDPLSTLNYLANIHENKDFNFHILKWNNCVVLRNCNKKGELIQLNKNTDSVPWILLTFKPFKFKNIVYPIFSCSQCSPNILKMSIEQDPADFSSILCAHSKVATSLVGNWSEKFGISTNSQNIRDSYKSSEKNDMEPIHCKSKTGSELQNLIDDLLMARFPYFTRLESKKFRDVQGAIQKIANAFSFSKKVKTKIKRYQNP